MLRCPCRDRRLDQRRSMPDRHELYLFSTKPYGLIDSRDLVVEEVSDPLLLTCVRECQREVIQI